MNLIHCICKNYPIYVHPKMVAMKTIIIYPDAMFRYIGVIGEQFIIFNISQKYLSMLKHPQIINMEPFSKNKLCATLTSIYVSQRICRSVDLPICSSTVVYAMIYYLQRSIT